MTTKTMNRLQSEARRTDAMCYDRVVTQGQRGAAVAKDLGITRVRLFQRIRRHCERTGLPYRVRRGGNRSDITLSQVAEIHRLRTEGHSYESIAELLDLEPGPVGRAARGDIREYQDGVEE